MVRVAEPSATLVACGLKLFNTEKHDGKVFDIFINLKISFYYQKNKQHDHIY